MEMPSTPAPKPRNKGSRPVKLTARSREVFLKALMLGASDTAAAHTAGFSMDALADYKKKDKTLSEEISRAYSQMQMRELARLEEASRLGDPNVKSRNAMWKLERHRATRDEFGRQALEITGRDGGPIKTESDLSFKIMENEAVRDAYYTMLRAIGTDMEAKAGVPPASATARVDGDSSSAAGASSEAPPPSAKASAPLRPALGPGLEEPPAVELWVPPPDRADPDAEWWAGPQAIMTPPKNVTPPAPSDDDEADDPDGELI
jgi:hypothetical protein